MRKVSIILFLSISLLSCSDLQNKRTAVELSDTAAMLNARYGDNVDSLQLRYGKSAAKEQVEHLKSRNEYPEMVELFENFDKKSYLQRMIRGGDTMGIDAE